MSSRLCETCQRRLGLAKPCYANLADSGTICKARIPMPEGPLVIWDETRSEMFRVPALCRAVPGTESLA